jgi:polyphosphate kinase 2 (PPK2 family)
MANDQELDLLKLEVSNLQRKAKDNKIPILIFIEGKNSKNKKELITKFLDPLEPRGYHFISVNKSIFKCNGKPKILLFLEKTPSFDQIYLLDKSWYSLNISLEEIEIIEKILSSYVLIIKFLINNKKPSKLYKKIYKFNLLKEWNILNNTNKLESLKNIFLVFKNKVEQIVKEKSEKPIIYDPKINVNSPSILYTIDLNKSLTETEYKEQLEYYQKELSSLQKKTKEKKETGYYLIRRVGCCRERWFYQKNC